MVADITPVPRSRPEYNGAGLASKGVVVITLNSRVGPLGFLAHPELTQESANHASGNYGLLEIIAALQWVQTNIAGFGDPNNITIYGESAGAQDESVLMASPLTRGLFSVRRQLRRVRTRYPEYQPVRRGAGRCSFRGGGRRRALQNCELSRLRTYLRWQALGDHPWWTDLFARSTGSALHARPDCRRSTARRLERRRGHAVCPLCHQPERKSRKARRVYGGMAEQFLICTPRITTSTFNTTTLV